MVLTGLRQLASVGVGEGEVKAPHLASVMNYCINILCSLCANWHLMFTRITTTRGRYSHVSTAHCVRWPSPFAQIARPFNLSLWLPNPWLPAHCAIRFLTESAAVCPVLVTTADFLIPDRVPSYQLFLLHCASSDKRPSAALIGRATEDGLLSLVEQFLTLRWLMSYIYGAPILDVSRSHTTTHHSR